MDRRLEELSVVLWIFMYIINICTNKMCIPRLYLHVFKGNLFFLCRGGFVLCVPEG